MAYRKYLPALLASRQLVLPNSIVPGSARLTLEPVGLSTAMGSTTVYALVWSDGPPGKLHGLKKWEIDDAGCVKPTTVLAVVNDLASPKVGDNLQFALVSARAGQTVPSMQRRTWRRRAAAWTTFEESFGAMFPTGLDIHVMFRFQMGAF